MSQPRTATSEEYDELMSFLEECYGHPKGFFQGYHPNIWARERFDPSNSLILREGRMECHVGAFPIPLAANGRTTTIGGIGAVATHPDFRGRGHMSTLMPYAADVMRKRGYPVAVLWGYRHRYLHFGYELCGTETCYNISNRSIAATGLKGSAFVKYDGDDSLLDTVRRLHEQEPVYVRRSPDDYKAVLGRSGMETFISSDGTAYAVLASGGEVRGAVEVGGDPSSVLQLLAGIMDELKLTALNVYRMYTQSATCDALYGAAGGWTWKPFTHLKILDLKATLEFFSGQIERKRRVLGLPDAGEVTLAIRETGDHATICPDGGVKMGGKESPARIELSEGEMVRRLFGTPGALEFHIPFLDHV